MRKSAPSWEEIFSLYNTIKYYYALSEETDSDLQTNLQPLNEFRAGLDHLMRIIAIERLSEYKEYDVEDEKKKLYGHLSRAFFDISDLLSIHYRRRINKALKKYSVNEIQTAIPEYYSKIQPRIAEMEKIFAEYRTEKRFPKSSEGEASVDTYSRLIVELSDYYQTVIKAIPALNEVKRKGRIPGALLWGIPVLIAIVEIVIGVVLR